MKDIFFFIGTEAEFIKVFPVIMKIQRNNMKCHIIASGQNDLKISRIMSFIELNGKFLELSQEKDIKKNAVGLLSWFIETKHKAKKLILEEFSRQQLMDAPIIVHGDTVSTYMGALIGREFHMKVCHVEAGLRSHHIFDPFPEEIDRLLTSGKTMFHFAPGEVAVNNLHGVKGKIINTKYNTIIDSLAYSQKVPVLTTQINEIIQQDYFVFVMHRQENIANKAFFIQVLDRIKKISKSKKCVLILHKITENALIKSGELEGLRSDKNFILLPRVDYFDFMKLLSNSKYIITDGGSNQEELHYMGKPCLIMRKSTERLEGIGQNAMLYGGNIERIIEFASNYENYVIGSVSVSISPSQIIANEIAILAE